jgi:hypothetical protein
MKLTKNVISRDEALKISPDYVKAVEGDFDALANKVLPVFEKLKRGQPVLTYSDGQFVKAKVSSMNSNDPRAEDGPIVRVSNDEYSWRVDGDRYAWPLNEVPAKKAPKGKQWRDREQAVKALGEHAVEAQERHSRQHGT